MPVTSRRLRPPSSLQPDLVESESIRNTLSTAGNSMTSSERASPQNHFGKKGGENSGNALEASNALNLRSWKSSESVSGIPEFLGKVPAVLRVWPKARRHIADKDIYISLKVVGPNLWKTSLTL